MGKVIVIGGGWAGISAAIGAKKRGAEVTLIERTDMLLGLGNVGGIMRNNGRYTAAEENIAMGASELFEITDRFALHKNIDFPGHNHASFYNVIMVEPEVKKLLINRDICVEMKTRITEVKLQDREIVSVMGVDSCGLHRETKTFEGDVFIDCTGTTGPMGNCREFGNGCSMCILRCPTFGPRVSISEKAGGFDYYGLRKDGGYGAFSGSCKLEKSSLSKDIQKNLNKKGVALIPLPQELINKSKLSLKVCSQYALPDFAENVILLDTGYAKMMTPFFPIEELRKVKGFENARFADPYGGGKGNSVRYMAITERDEYLRVKNVDNLFCAGEKAGPFIGHTEAISTGSLAGYNAGTAAAERESLMNENLPGKEDASYTKISKLLTLPESTAIGAFLKYPGKKLRTFAGDEFFDYMKMNGLYTTEKCKIRERVDAAGLLEIYNGI